MQYSSRGSTGDLPSSRGGFSLFRPTTPLRPPVSFIPLAQVFEMFLGGLGRSPTQRGSASNQSHWAGKEEECEDGRWRADRSVAAAPEFGKHRAPTAFPPPRTAVVHNLAVKILAASRRRTGGEVTGRCQALSWNATVVVERRKMSTEQGAVERGTTSVFQLRLSAEGSPQPDRCMG
ncbi:uncharacterized protein BO80DRAFT_99235 [Aspergillus ibericus CBS 121593]|uniref:Uncharacterized protein n=1 Tax=Aspergillus ibericus CBS 121593 TaxID=1448316 RepID=A0A395H2M5_9EURO|nr:hypothetical protein BO80DRAFT_99235 [Aspergillus ibericus CBS 121593]RAL00474.1 hypothetical protein BO80DRAFT_99235 [Aspergillus ibericus CBS 121593]